MTAAALAAFLEHAGIRATVATSAHRSLGEREEGHFDSLTLHTPNGSITLCAAGENAYDVWLEAAAAPAQPQPVDA